VKPIRMNRVSIVVPDLDAAVKDFEEVFGMSFSVAVDEELGVKRAISDAGLDLVASLDPDRPGPAAANWSGGALAAIGFRVGDIDEIRSRMRARGVRGIHDADRPGLRESIYDSHDFHDLPVALHQYEGDSFVDAAGAAPAG